MNIFSNVTQSLSRKSIFYIHVPKTAGSSLNNFFASQFHDFDHETHIESKNILGMNDAQKISEQFRFLSGHIPFRNLKIKLNLNDWYTVATFRNPVDHIISHICWVRLLAESQHAERLKNHPPEIQTVVLYLKSLNLSKPKEVKKFVRWLESENQTLFHNTQTQYLCDERLTFTNTSHNIKSAVENLNLINYIGVTERLDEFYTYITLTFGFKNLMSNPRKENQNANRFGLDSKNEAIMAELAPLIDADEIVYSTAKRLFTNKFHALIADIENSMNDVFTPFDKEKLDYLVQKISSNANINQ